MGGGGVRKKSKEMVYVMEEGCGFVEMNGVGKGVGGEEKMGRREM